MTAAAPVRKLSVNSVLPLLACIALLPSVWIFCGVHGPSAQKIEKASTVSTIMFFSDQPNQIGLRSQADLTPSPRFSGQVFTGDPNTGSMKSENQSAKRTEFVSVEPKYDGNQSTSLVIQQAEQNTIAVAQSCEQQLWPDFTPSNDTYDGLSYFCDDDVIGNLVQNITALAINWLQQIPLPVVVLIGSLVTLNFGFVACSGSRWF
jgi:hypothetical protein